MISQENKATQVGEHTEEQETPLAGTSIMYHRQQDITANSQMTS